MKATDAMALAFRQQGLEHFFTVSGGAAVHLIDSLARSAAMGATFHNHEQAAALAADAYARLRGLGLCVVTTGPGVTNTITGTLCSWQDSVPTVYLSGQARRANAAEGFTVRQGGTQHLNVESLVRSVVKHVFYIRDSREIFNTVLEAVDLAQTGRKGPVWIDFPLDQQLRQIQHPQPQKTSTREAATTKDQEIWVVQALEAFSRAQAPLVVLGRGASASSQVPLASFVERLRAPVVRTWGGIEALAEFPGLDVGRIGISGQRAANIVAGSADVVLSLGARFGQAVTGPTLGHLFRSDATVFSVDVDPEELRLLESETSAVGIHMTVDDFIQVALKQNTSTVTYRKPWLEFCSSVIQLSEDEYVEYEGPGVDQYDLVKAIDSLLGKNDVLVVDGGGTGFYCAMQVFGRKSTARIIIPTGSAPMGTGIPQAIGASVAQPQSTVAVVCGDGSLPFNMQDLAVIKEKQLPIKVFVLNNDGYLSIRDTQDQFLDGLHLGSDAEGGLCLPSVEAVAQTFLIDYITLNSPIDLQRKVKTILSMAGPSIVEIIVRPDQQVHPRTGFTDNGDGTFSPLPLSDMCPRMKSVPCFRDVARDLPDSAGR